MYFCECYLCLLLWMIISVQSISFNGMLIKKFLTDIPLRDIYDEAILQKKYAIFFSFYFNYCYKIMSWVLLKETEIYF